MTVPSDPQYLYLTTTGWKSGRAHEIEIWFVELNGSYFLISEKRERSHWVQNLRHQPRVSFRLEGTTRQARAEVLEAAHDEGLRKRVCALFQKKYGWNTGVVVRLVPES